MDFRIHATFKLQALAAVPSKIKWQADNAGVSVRVN